MYENEISQLAFDIKFREHIFQNHLGALFNDDYAILEDDISFSLFFVHDGTLYHFVIM